MRHRVAVLGVLTGVLAFGLVRDVSGGEPTKEEIADLVDELRDPDAHVRDVARRQLAALGDKAVGTLITLLGGDTTSRDNAIQVLTMIGPAAKAATPALTERAKAATGPARLPILRALAAIDPAGSSATAIPFLLAFLDDRDPELRMAAADALRAYGPSAAKYAADVLARIPSAHGAERAALLDAVRAMGVDAAQAVVDLYFERGESDRQWLATVISDLGEAVVPAAVARMTSEDKAVRASAIRVIGAVGPAAKSAAPNLILALKDPVGAVRRNAAEALGAIGPDPKVGGIL